MKKAYSYVRFSTPEQLKGDSLRRQSEATEKWCRENALKLVENYQDLGVSAFKGKNAATGALSKFLQLARAGRIEKGSYLVVESLDRITRADIMDALDIFTGIIRAGINLVTLSDNQVYTREKINENPLQLIISLTVLSRANEESRIKAHRVGAAWIAKRKNLDKGEKMTARCVAWLKLSEDRKTFEPIPERAAIVRRMFEMIVAGSGANSITKTLRSEKVPTFGSAKVWHVSYVKKILENRAVIGELHPHTHRSGTKRTATGEVISGYYPEVVTKELFATVQQIRKARPCFKGKSGFNVFSKLAFDKDSNTPMTYVNKNRAKSWHYLVPWSALRGQTAYICWQYDDFLANFLALCNKAALSKPEPIKTDNGLAAKRMELADTEKQISRLVDFLAAGSSGAVESKLRQLEEKRIQVQQEIADVENESKAAPLDIAKIDWKDTKALRENLRATVKRITMDAKTRWFKAEFFDGRIYTLETKGENVIITTPDPV